MTSVPVFWEDDPATWARVTITDGNGTLYALPGVATVECESTYGLDIRVTPLAEGANYIATGNQPQSIKITLTMWLPAHWTDWSVLYGILQPPAKRQIKPKAFGVFHPVLAAQGVTSMIVKKINSPKHTSTGGPATASLECVEYKPLQPIKSFDIKPDTRDVSLSRPILGTEPAAPPSRGKLGDSGGIGSGWTPRR